MNSYTLKAYHLSKDYKNGATAFITNDSIGMKIIYDYTIRNYHKKLIKTYLRKGGYLYERFIITNLDNFPVDTNYVLSFCKKDTLIKYQFDSFESPPGMYQWEYLIKKNNKNSFYLLKKHLTDKRFVEEFFYDSCYNIREIRIYHGEDTLMFK